MTTMSMPMPMPINLVPHRARAFIALVAVTVTISHFQSSCSSFVIVPALTSQSPAAVPATSRSTNLFSSFSSSSSSSSSNNPIEDESEEERQSRMTLVRQLQKSFYINEESTHAPSQDSTYMEDVPLWRTQWTELPGFQNVLNVHVPHYTNMFQKILRSSNQVKYFGHMYLPDTNDANADGSNNNLDNPEYKLEEGTKASLTGVLMKITAHKELDDGTLVLVVQALEKFRIVNVKRHYSPYSIATIEITPDEELIQAQKDCLVLPSPTISSDDTDTDTGTHTHTHQDLIIDDDSLGAAAAVAEAFNWHGFEFEPVTTYDFPKEMKMTEDMNNNYSGDDEGVTVSPLVNYNLRSTPSRKVGMDDTNTNVDESVLEYEFKVWVLIDEMIHLLQSIIDPRKEKPIPIPTQILGLLPTNPIHPWPESFSLEKYAIKLEKEGVVATRTSTGTSTTGTTGASLYDNQEKFMRVSNYNTNYPPIRRAQRLSYIIWALTDTIVLPDSTTYDCSRQRILEVDSVKKRLDVGMRKLQVICLMIRNVLDQYNNL